MSDGKTKAELEAENDDLEKENARLRELVDSKNITCPNCGFNTAQQDELLAAKKRRRL